jgi:hypothetical protein
MYYDKVSGDLFWVPSVSFGQSGHQSVVCSDELARLFVRSFDFRLIGVELS